jgi:hypothetical protein
MCRLNGGLRTNITYLTDILVADTADLLDVGSTLGDTLEGVSGKLELILDVGGGDNVDTGLSSHAANVLLTEEVTKRDSQFPCPTLAFSWSSLS